MVLSTAQLIRYNTLLQNIDGQKMLSLFAAKMKTLPVMMGMWFMSRHAVNR